MISCDYSVKVKSVSELRHHIQQRPAITADRPSWWRPFVTYVTTIDSSAVPVELVLVRHYYLPRSCLGRSLVVRCAANTNISAKALIACIKCLELSPAVVHAQLLLYTCWLAAPKMGKLPALKQLACTGSR